jgi:NAD(P)-dependent dehydrogenase (short-subunit alcohol dehydrogenase family)
MPLLSGKTAIVTGGTSGMGRAIAELFAAEGASVVIGGRDEQRGAEVIAGICSRGGRAALSLGDVGTPEPNRRLVETAVEQFHGIDILVPNVGALGLGSLTEISLDFWHQAIATNLHSVFYLLHYGIPRMAARGGGTIVMTGSIAAFRGFPRHAAYCAAKAALVGLVRQVANDYGPSIRANLLCPGPVDTPLLWDSAAAFPQPERAVADSQARTLLGRLGTPRDIAQAALFLASEQSSWITGASLTIDGGITCA